DVTRPDPADGRGGPPGEASADVAARVTSARARAAERGVRCNAELPASRFDEVAPLTPGALRLLDHAVRSGALSGRGVHRVWRVARTIGDLAGRDVRVTEEN